MNALLRRSLTTTGATVGALAVLTGTALAHDCYVGTPSSKTPKAEIWHSFTVAGLLAEQGIFTAACDEQLTAGEAALRAAGLPVSLKVFVPEEERVLAHKASDRVMSDGKGLERFSAGSVDFGRLVDTFVGGATSVECAEA